MSDYAIPVVITRCVLHDHQPPIVECVLVDAHDRVWRFEEKCAVPSARPLDGDSPYPQPGLFACELLTSRTDEEGRQLSTIETSPWSVTALDEAQTDRFEVCTSSLIPYRWPHPAS